MAAKYVYDRDSLKFKKATRSIRKGVWNVIRFFVWSATISIIAYGLIAIFFSTEEEKRLLIENKMYEKLYPEMLQRQQMVSDVVTGLKITDSEIYNRLFHTESPMVDPSGQIAFSFAFDSLEVENLSRYTSSKAQMLSESAARTEDNFMRIFSSLAARDSTGEHRVPPPMSLPIRGVNYAQVGASVGARLSPFLKIQVEHNGLDIIAAQGASVLATADGTVTGVTYSRKGLGNVVEIDHGNGYTTRYAHLADVKVHKGQKVTKGKKLAEVGISGSSVVPHLHYEVLRDTLYQDPVHYFFGDVSPVEYSDMIYMSICTEQSQD